MTKSIKFDSKFEQQVYGELSRSKVTYSYHPRSFSYAVLHSYQPDFKLVTKTGKEIFIETKGYFTAADRSKLQRVRDTHSIDLRLVFMNENNRLNKSSTTTYAMWCDKHGFKWSSKSVPKEWTDE